MHAQFCPSRAATPGGWARSSQPFCATGRMTDLSINFLEIAVYLRLQIRSTYGVQYGAHKLCDLRNEQPKDLDLCFEPYEIGRWGRHAARHDS